MCEETSLRGPILCPFCDTHSQYKVLASYSTREYRQGYYYFGYCTNCGNPIITLCKDCFSTEELYWYPARFVQRTFDDDIVKLSHRFCDIYNQALLAEKCECFDIAGMGYRKSLEVLIKDYLIYFLHEDSDTIKAMTLNNCIMNKIQNEKLRITASRSAWLGNDYAHYVSKFADKDIHDLKRYIDATVHWISLEIITNEARQIERH